MTTEQSISIRELIPDGILPNSSSRQESKSSHMRLLILNATVECLAKHGYANTTNNQVCEIAKISRGAMLHHYPTRYDLLEAVIEYTFYKHLSDFSKKVANLSDPDRAHRNSAIAIDWELCQTVEYQAYLELQAASRTNPELRKIFQPRARTHDMVWKDELLRVFPEWSKFPRELDLARRFVRSILDGMCINQETWKDKATEATILAFLAKLMLLIRTGELQFPSEEEIELFLGPVRSVANRKQKVANKEKPKKSRKAGTKAL